MASPPASAQDQEIELVYFNIHARGELTRLCFAATGKFSQLKDKRIPLFMDSSEAARNWAEVQVHKAPFGYVPYLNVRDAQGAIFQVSGDGPVEMFAARHVGGLLGRNEVHAGICETIVTRSLGMLGPPLTRAGLQGDPTNQINGWLQPKASDMAHILEHLEDYVRKVKEESYRQQPPGTIKKYILGGEQLSLADLAIYNCLDECMHGPRSMKTMCGVRQTLENNYPELLTTYEAVAGDLADYLTERQTKHQEQPDWTE